MAQFRTIEIDFEIHQFIESKRRSFDDSDLCVLRRELGIDRTTPSDTIMPLAPASPDNGSGATGRAWRDGNMILPHGTQLRMTYNGSHHQCEIRDGEWIVEGHAAKSPSGAAKAVARTRRGDFANINGKEYWEVKRPGDSEWELYLNLERRTKNR